MAEDATIEDWFREDRSFPPPEDFVADALVTDRSLYDEADADHEAFWARQARELLTWSKDFTPGPASGTCPSPSGSSAAS